MVVRRYGRQHHVLGGSVRMARERVMGMRVVDLGDERARVAAVGPLLCPEGRQSRRRKKTGGGGGRGAGRTAIVGRR